MVARLFIVGLCVAIAMTPVLAAAGSAEVWESAYWSNLVHQENSIAASVLYLPYLFLSIPVRLIDGVVNPKPTSQSTTPPPAHRVPHQ
jgi:hypothetical protein